MKRNKEQTYHFLLSFKTSTLVKWYNDSLIDPFSDFSEQTLRENTENIVADLKDALSLETLLQAGRNPHTKYSECDRYFALTGCDKPYFVSFDTFEQFLNGIAPEDKDGFLDFLLSVPEHLEALEEMAKEEK